MKKARPWLGPGLVVVKRAAGTPQVQHTLDVGNGGCDAARESGCFGGLDCVGGCGIDDGIDDDMDDGIDECMDDDIDDATPFTLPSTFFTRVCEAIGASQVNSTRQHDLSHRRTPS